MKTKVKCLFILFLISSMVGIAQENATQLLLNYIRLEADQISNYQGGFAIISRGQQSTMIDRFGREVIPYGTFKFTNLGFGDDRCVEGFDNNYCIVQDPKSYKLGFVDTLGKLVINYEYRWASPFDDDGYAVVIGQDSRNYFISRQNRKIPIDPVFIYDKHLMPAMPNVRGENGGLEALFEARPSVQTGPVIYAEFVNGLCVGKKDLFGYYNRFGKKIIDNIYIQAQPFSEGLAAVAQKNSFGEIKWGFIDEKGKTVIDFMFRNQPGNFHNGLSVVFPAEKSDFSYAFMDKTGSIFYTVKDSKKNEFKDFQGNVAFVRNSGRMMLLDRSGALHPLIIKSTKNSRSNNSVNLEAFSYYQNIVNDNILIEIANKQGLIDVKGNTIVPAMFEKLSYFDPVSNLAKATYLTPKGDKIEGYINKNIHFVSVKEMPKSKW
ncbi:WG repeat-containing protein [Pedobacter sp. SAFR-022]|uniref:WG repeat-containing protein n=1 Tax=Pedobacter sp. SAFR-022 TaxID=3436861 RepID=UPI003F80D291